MSERYCFVNDGDCNYYLIPVNMKPLFRRMLEFGELDHYSEFNAKFEEWAIGSCTNWTFENPKEDA